MTRSYNSPGDLHLPRAESDGYQDRETPGWKQFVCACFILLAVAALFKLSDLNSVNRTAPFAHVTDMTRLAGEIERWERGEPRQATVPVHNSDRFILVSSIDQ
jgi:hypothetical protein